MKAFTFLGRGPLYNSTYVFHDKECETQFFAEAIVNFFSPESLFFIATESAAKEPVSDENKCERLGFLTKLLGDKTEVVHILIKEGANENELWDIFDSVVSNIHDNDSVLFDITHGFRSLPFLTFLALAYVRNVRSGVEIERVIYGAFDAVERNNPRKPVFDLTPFVSLLDWLGAVTMFQQTGDARPIASLNVDRKIDGALTSLSNALLTNRTLEAQDAARVFNGLKFESEQAPPFQMLIDQLKKSYQQMAVYDPTGKPKQSLKAQYQQIKWYVENRHYLQAITLMREWLISWKCIETNQNRWLNMDRRKNVENNLNERANRAGNPLATGLAQLAPDQPAIDLWNQCNGIRRDLAHCGMRHDPQESADAIEAIQNLFCEFEKFVQKNASRRLG